jgi:glycine/D-amino acid oxidase-like deaminating enzyme
VVRKMYAASLESIDVVEGIVTEEGIDCSFARCGHLEVACKETHFDGYIATAAETKREFNHELRVISKSELNKEIGSDIYYGGLVDESSASVNPAQYAAGLAAAAQSAGARLYERARVIRAAAAGLAEFQLFIGNGTRKAQGPRSDCGHRSVYGGCDS